MDVEDPRIRVVREGILQIPIELQKILYQKIRDEKPMLMNGFIGNGTVF